MSEFTGFLSLLVSASGLTVLIVWPEDGPSAWIRERIFRRLLAGPRAKVLDCYLCNGFWTGFLFSPLWWVFYRELWCWFSCLMVPALFWILFQLTQERP